MKILNKIHIKSKSAFVPERSDLEKSIYFFIYKIEINNLTNDPIKLLTRHWDIKDANGNINMVDGDGVVGETPTIDSNEKFTYTSFCPLKTNFGSMKGYYTFSKKDGEVIKTMIPEFSLIVPSYIN
tara:strand:- start:246 stop:623 length:378 start_codon:yes stop_codon:yes gene_type:complete